MMKAPIPVLRIFDETKAKAFYCDFLGFTWNWEHRHAPGFPLYFQVTQGESILHLSEHHGDATPGSTIRIFTPALTNYCTRLRLANNRYCMPGLPEAMPWGTTEIRLCDPFGNNLIFFEK